MTDIDLGTRYRNLLIMIARDAEDIRLKVLAMRLAVPSEESNGKRNGMRTLINARNLQRARMLQFLSSNKAACRHYFGTTDPRKIADAEIILH